MDGVRYPPQVTRRENKPKRVTRLHHPDDKFPRPSVKEQEGLDSDTPNVKTYGSRALGQTRVTPNNVNSQSPRPPQGALPTESVMQNNTMFQNAQGVNISGNPNFHNVHNVGSVTNVYGGTAGGMEHLNGSISYDAQFDSSAQDPDRQCHPGTRENVLNRLRGWFDDPNSEERIFWLYGPAGAGKSAIARTIADSCGRPKVAATFFFFKSDNKRNDGNRLFTTLAYQIALSMPEIKGYIANSLSERPDLPTTDVKTQFKHLLARPFQVLHEDGAQQSAAQDIIEKYQKLSPIIIIDGIDECIDEKLQQKFLKVIGDGVEGDHLPFRFLIVSRPEVHIEQTIRRFQSPIFTIDLAALDDANKDIEKYLVDEFCRIASEQGLEPTWPGQDIIEEIIYKSSGNFIYASVVIRFVGDPYSFAKTQLEIVMNLKPPKSMSPFAVLNQLFLEILGRVPDQDFLKKYLALLVARISVSSGHGDLYKDDAVLMHVSVQELHAHLRRMRSLLILEDKIDVHHRSFLDFLHDSSRSGQYHVREQRGIRGYLDFFVDSLVGYVYIVISHPDRHKSLHFAPTFRSTVTKYPPEIQLSIKDWKEVTQPLLDLQDKLLQLPDFTSTWDLLPCDECTVFHLLRELLYLGLHLGFQANPKSGGAVDFARDLRKRRGAIGSTTTIKTNTNENDLDNILLSLLSHLPKTMENLSTNERVFDLTNTLMHFNWADTATRIRSISDAQKMVDLLYYAIHTKNVLHPDTKRTARLLVLEIFTRVPIFPLRYSLDKSDIPHYNPRHTTSRIDVLSQTIFAHKILDHRYVMPMLEENKRNSGVEPVGAGAHNDILTMDQWRQRSPPTTEIIIQIMHRVAKAIQYLHSVGVILDSSFCLTHVYLDSHLCPKIHCLCSISSLLLDKELKSRLFPETNIFSFGCLFYELYTGIDTMPDHKVAFRKLIIENRPSEPNFPEYMWQLIQNCCADDLKRRPTISEVVDEMEGWTCQTARPVELDEAEEPEEDRHIDQRQTCFGALSSIFGGNLCR